MNIVSNCPLCEQHSLHIIGQEEVQMLQCLSCGYTSTSKFIGDKETNEEIKNQIKELQEALTLLKLVDNGSKLEVQHLQQHLDKLFNKIYKNEN